MSVCPIQFNQIGKSASKKSYKSYIDSCLPVSIKMYEFFVSLMLHPLCLRVLTLCFDISVNIDRTSLLHIRWLKSFIQIEVSLWLTSNLSVPDFLSLNLHYLRCTDILHSQYRYCRSTYSQNKIQYYNKNNIQVYYSVWPFYVN